MGHIKYIANFFLVVLVIIFFSFFYNGIITTIPKSADYNIPIAQIIAAGKFFVPPTENIYIYSPGSSHAILSIFLIGDLPINLFGLLSWVCLFIVCKKLGDTFGLKQYMSIIFAASICTTASVIRTIGDQSIDKWLCTWFILSIILLEKPQRNWKFSLLIGFSLGMLIGTKYSGPLFFLALLPIYGKTLFRILNLPRLLLACLTFIFFGLFWYIRNFILKGNPYFPANLPFFKGHPNFTQQDWMLWKIPFEYPAGILPLLYAFLSEYMIWVFSGIITIWYCLHFWRNKLKVDNKIIRLSFLALTTGLVSLLLPVTPAYYIEHYHIVSDMRYIYIVMTLLNLTVFLIADKYKMNNLLATIALINTIPIFSFIPYQPKIFIIILLIIILFSVRSPKITQKYL